MERTPALRADGEAWFSGGDYHPLQCRGKYADHVIALSRANGKVIVAVPRFTPELVDSEMMPVGRDVWADTAIILPGGRTLYNNLTEEIVNTENTAPVSNIFETCPVAVLIEKERS